jgi:hypothetical protein
MPLSLRGSFSVSAIARFIWIPRISLPSFVLCYWSLPFVLCYWSLPFVLCYWSLPFVLCRCSLLLVPALCSLPLFFNIVSHLLVLKNLYHCSLILFPTSLFSRIFAIVLHPLFLRTRGLLVPAYCSELCEFVPKYSLP